MDDAKKTAFRKAALRCSQLDREILGLPAKGQILYLVAIETWAGAMLELMKSERPELKSEISKDYLAIRSAFLEKLKTGREPD